MNTINAARTEVRGLDDLPAVVATPPRVAAPCPVADVLERAADYMDRHGKCEGKMQDSSGRVCAIGAINAVSGTHSVLHWVAVKTLDDFIDSEWLAYWSDSHDQATVVSTMRACAALEMAKA